MNAESHDAVAISAFVQTLSIGFVIVSIALGIGGWLIIFNRPSPQLKKMWSDRLAILGGFIIFDFTATICLSAPVRSWRHFEPIFIIGIICALITWLNVRSTYYCDKCGKPSLNPYWFANSAYHCPKCGNKLS
jgi:hypothetical protein